MKARRRRRRRTILGGVSKSDFIAIAEILCSHGASTGLKEGFANYFKSHNPRFDRGRFLKATNSCSR
jgi:hypothetical protein